MSPLQPLRPGFGIIIFFAHRIRTAIRELFLFQNTQPLRLFLDFVPFNMPSLVMIM